MTTANRKQIILSVDAETNERLEAAAYFEGVSVDEYCREAIEVQLDEDAVFRAPIKLTRESVERYKRNRERTANANDNKSASKPPFGRESSDGLSVAVRNDGFGDKIFSANSADDIREMREERALNIERASKGRRRKPRD